MGKLKNLFSNVSNSIKETFKKFPITMIIVYISTIIVAFSTDSFLEKFFDNMWMYMLGFFALGSFFCENFFKNNIVRNIGHVVALLIALGIRLIMINEIYMTNLTLMNIIMAYMLVIPLITIYKMLKDSEISVKEYAIRVLSNMGKTTTIYFLANLGILVVMLVFIELILDGNDYDILPRTLILLFGGFYIPSMIDAIVDVKNETGKFIKILLTAILMPVAMFLIATLYIYVIKIILNGELLNKSLFFILSLTFTLTIPGVILLRNYYENKAVCKISNVLFYSFIPLLVLQIIAMNTRVAEYGLTESRYLGYLLITFEIICIALMIIKKSKYLDKIILVMSGFVIFALFGPFNIYDVTAYSQTKRITDMLSTVEKFEDLSTEEKNECKKALVYVKRGFKPEYLNKKLSKEQKETIEAYAIEYIDDIYNESTNYEYLHMPNLQTGINIEGFKTIYPYDDYYNQADEIDINNYELIDENGNVKAFVDLENFVREMYKAEKLNAQAKKLTFEKLRYLTTSDENIVFCVTNFSIRYEEYSNKLDHISIEGYLLVK